MNNIYTCIFCNSENVIKHGKTSNNVPRLRCNDCNKTFVIKEFEFPKIEIWKVADFYLAGKSYRNLVAQFKSSPRQLNIKIRDFLGGCPNWEDYLDTFIDNHYPKVIYLTSIKFSCSYKSDNNCKSILMAIDLHSSLVLAYQICDNDSETNWDLLFNRLKERNIAPKYFISNGNEFILDKAKMLFPESFVRFNYHKSFRDKELACCINHYNFERKLVTDTINIYSSFKNKNLLKIFELHSLNELKLILKENNHLFMERVKNRLNYRMQNKVDNFIFELKERLEKFHLIRENPEPIINALIARSMLVNSIDGFSRLSYYAQMPLDANISDFACARMPRNIIININNFRTIQFIIEILARSVELPILASNCKLESDQCQLV